MIDKKPTIKSLGLEPALRARDGYKNFGLLIKGNTKDKDIQFCIDQAKKAGCGIDVRIGEHLLKMSHSQRRKAAALLCSGGCSTLSNGTPPVVRRPTDDCPDK